MCPFQNQVETTCEFVLSRDIAKYCIKYHVLKKNLAFQQILDKTNN